jgi:hypothetical protein
MVDGRGNQYLTLNTQLSTINFQPGKNTMSSTAYCECQDQECGRDIFEFINIGTRHSEGMYTSVDLWCCRECATMWLRYTAEDENRPGWGKWYRGAIADEDIDVDALTIEKATEIMSQWEWHFYGGAYYRTSGERSAGPVAFRSAEEAELAEAA